MSQYIPPNYDEIIFKFKSGYYSPPSNSNINFNFSHNNYTDLAASVDTDIIYNNSTYTYLKHCYKNIVGFDNGIVRTFKFKCVYGGIRDLLIDIISDKYYKYDLYVFINSQLLFKDLTCTFRLATADYNDIIGFVKLYYRDYTNLLLNIRALNFLDLSSIIRPSSIIHFNLKSFIRFIDNTEINSLYSYFRIFKSINSNKFLNSNILSIPPVDIIGNIHIVFNYDLISYITGEYYKGYSDLYTIFNKIYLRFHKDLLCFYKSYDYKNINGHINAKVYKQLKVNIVSGGFNVYSVFNGYLNLVTPKSLVCYITPLSFYDLESNINVLYTNLFIVGNIQVVNPAKLLLYINVFTEIESYKDIKCFLYNDFFKDILCNINIIYNTDILCNINSIGKYKDIVCNIVPEVIHVKNVINVQLLNSNDLYGIINYTCFYSKYTDLYANVHISKYKDIKVYIVGWYGDYSRNVKKLSGYISINNDISISYIDVNYTYYNTYFSSVCLHVDYYSKYKIIDYTTVYVGNSFSDLLLTIQVEKEYLSLIGNLTCIPLPNFTTISPWVDPKHRIVTIDIRNIKNIIYKFVEFMFVANVNKPLVYFYFSDENKIYKIDKNSTWKLKLVGYRYNNDKYIKYNLNEKVVFNISKFSTIDECVTHYIDMVTSKRIKNLYVDINVNVDKIKYIKCDIQCKCVKKWLTELYVGINII